MQYYIYLLVSDYSTENEHFLNSYDIIKVNYDVVITRNNIVMEIMTNTN